MRGGSVLKKVIYVLDKYNFFFRFYLLNRDLGFFVGDEEWDMIWYYIYFYVGDLYELEIKIKFREVWL